MKTAMPVVMTLTLAILIGCQMSPRGGSTVRGEGFKIAVPTFSTHVKQGELQTVTVSVKRDSQFMQDVTLQVEAPEGISIEPSRAVIKASDKPELQLVIAAPKDAGIGEYPVVVKGTAETGPPTSVEFTVKVVAP